MQWFRMYAEFATDPVVQSMSFDDQRHFVIILCMKCSGALDREFGDPQTRIVMLRRALGLDALAFDEAKNRLCSSGLINGEWQPKNWEKRQFVTDHSAAERMRKYRERHRDVTVTSPVTKSDVLDTESEADTEQSKRARPKRASRLPEDFSPDLEYARKAIPDIEAEAEFARFRDYWTAKSGANGTKADWPATWRNWIRNCQESGRYARKKEEVRAKRGLPTLNG